VATVVAGAVGYERGVLAKVVPAQP